jgi:hypothetical protein
MDSVLDVGFQPHTNSTFYITIFHRPNHSRRYLHAFEAYIKGIILSENPEKGFCVLSQRCSRGYKVTMETTECSSETETEQYTRLSFQDWVKNPGQMVWS